MGISPGENGWEYLIRGQIAGSISPRGRWLGVFCQGADSCQKGDGRDNFARWRVSWSISPGDG